MVIQKKAVHVKVDGQLTGSVGPRKDNVSPRVKDCETGKSLYNGVTVKGDISCPY